jgi:hypothetical protein
VLVATLAMFLKTKSVVCALLLDGVDDPSAELKFTLKGMVPTVR